jgi:hypothetical protein
MMDYVKYKKARQYYWSKRATLKHINYEAGLLCFVKFGIEKPTGLVDEGLTDWSNDLTYDELSGYNYKVINELRIQYVRYHGGKP